MEHLALDKAKKLQSEQSEVAGILIAEKKGLNVFNSGEMEPNDSGYIASLTSLISKLDKKEPYPTIVLESENKKCLIKSDDRSCVAILYHTEQLQ